MSLKPEDVKIGNFYNCGGIFAPVEVLQFFGDSVMFCDMDSGRVTCWEMSRFCKSVRKEMTHSQVGK